VFTGIVEELGEVVAVEEGGACARLTVHGPLVTADASRGGSIAVNGVCLTVTDAANGQFSADIMGETLARSSLGSLAPGSRVNLERPMRPDDRLGGHIVQGHVDGTGAIIERRPAGDWEVARISMPAELARYVVRKGSVTVDGVSLTVSGLGREYAGGASRDWLEVSLIPETLARTTLGSKQAGALVNLEVDMIAKYVERLLAAAGRLA
jgi:riboflavin synthase